MTVLFILLSIMAVLMTALLFLLMMQRKHIIKQDRLISEQTDRFLLHSSKEDLSSDLIRRNQELRIKLAHLDVQNKNLMAMYQDIRNSCIVLPKDKALFYFIKLDHVDKENYTASFSIN